MTALLRTFARALVVTLALLPTAPEAQTSVVIAGSLQSELGCANDWDPSCAATQLLYDATDGVWQRTFTVPAGTWEQKAALDGSLNENYGANAKKGGANIAFTLAQATEVKFYYDHETHWVTSSQNAVIAVAPGISQTELGCPGDWQPDCLRSWLQDPDGDGVYAFATSKLPAGSYEAKVAIGESWDLNYGAGARRTARTSPSTSRWRAPPWRSGGARPRTSSPSPWAA